MHIDVNIPEFKAFLREDNAPSISLVKVLNLSPKRKVDDSSLSLAFEELEVKELVLHVDLNGGIGN